MENNQPSDLFEFAEKYPNAPALGVTDTSSDAAALIRQKGHRYLQMVVFRSLQKSPGTWKEVARRLNEKPENVQPRFSELKELGLIVGTGERSEKCEIYRATQEKDFTNDAPEDD